MKLYSWNVNGIRAVGKKGFAQWVAEVQPDFLCVQEIKAFSEQVEPEVRNPFGMSAQWHSAKKPGYSGVATYYKKEPLSVQVGLGNPLFDDEGRVLTIETRDFYLINAYFPNSQREHTRLDYKLKFCNEMLSFCDSLKRKGKGVILCGDYNIAHQAIDLKNPKANEDNAGFLPEERAWMTQFLNSGYLDIFRKRQPEGGFYTWWSYRPGIRERNIGWRIDYHCINSEFEDRVIQVGHLPQVKGSDHCPIYLETKN